MIKIIFSLFIIMQLTPLHAAMWCTMAGDQVRDTPDEYARDILGVCSWPLGDGFGGRSCSCSFSTSPRPTIINPDNGVRTTLYDVTVTEVLSSGRDANGVGLCDRTIVGYDWRGPVECTHNDPVKLKLSYSPNISPVNKDGNTVVTIQAEAKRNEVLVKGQRVDFELVQDPNNATNGKFGNLGSLWDITEWTGPNIGIASNSYFTPTEVSEKQNVTIRATCYVVCIPATLDLPLEPKPILIGFFNGVWNTDEQGNTALQRLKREYGDTYQKVPLKYDLFYNQTGSSSGAPGGTFMQDLAEVMMMRDSELTRVFGQRLEFIWDMLAGRYQQPTSLTASVLAYLQVPRDAILRALEALFNSVFSKIVASIAAIMSSPPTVQDIAAQTQKAVDYANKKYRLVFVAHSQGNLFVNRTYDNLLQAVPSAKAQVVHIAPASPTLRGGYVLADIDLVINALRLQGVTTVPGINLILPISGRDPSGHTFIDTYLDTSRAGYARSKALITTGLNILVNQ